MIARGFLVLAVVMAGLTAAAVTTVPPDLKVTEIVTNGKVFATFSAPNAFTDDLRKVMQSGLQLKFSFTVELRRPALLVDRTLAGTTVVASATFDSLTAQYQVSKLRDGRGTKSDHLDKEADVRAWLTTFDQVPLEPGEPLEPNADYYLRVRLRTEPRPTMTWWPPWGKDDGSGRKDFTFVR